MAMASAASGRGRDRRLVYKVKSSRASDGNVVYSCIFSCIDDVEHHRHRRNPFDPKYIQAALSSFDELGRDDCKSVATREEVEAASTSVHVRMELIKSMKDGLVKLTNEAAKHCKGVTRKAPKNKSTLEGNKVHVLEKESTQLEGGQPDDFLKDNSFDIYQRKFGQAFEALQVKRQLPGLLVQNYEKSATKGSIELGLVQALKELDVYLNGNPNFVSEDELCFSINKETMMTLHNMLQRTQSDIKPATFSEDDFADLSPFKGFISPITKDLILESEDSQNAHQSAENVEEDTQKHNEAMTNAFQKEYIENDSAVSNEVFAAGFEVIAIPLEHSASPELYEVASSVAMNKPLVALKNNHACDGSSSKGASAAIPEPDDISSPTIDNQELMEISSMDEVMEDISGEEFQDEIEDGEIPETKAGTNVHFCIPTQDIEKFILLRRQLKRCKNLWLAPNPEKLLLPDTNNSNYEPNTDDIHSFVQSSLTVGRIFREALSRNGMDLIEHYKLLQEDPSKIPGALRFDAWSTNSELNDLSSTADIDKFPQDFILQNQNLKKSVQENELDDNMGHCNGKDMSWKEELQPLPVLGNMVPSQRSPLSSVCQTNSLITGKSCWDKFSWSTGLTSTGQSIEYMQSAKCNKNSDRFLKQGIDDFVGNSISSVHESHSLYGVMKFCGHNFPAEQHEALQNSEVMVGLQPICTSLDSIQSSGVVDEDMEVANQDDVVSNIGGRGKIHTAAVADSTISSLSSEKAVCHQIFPSGVEGLVKGSQVEKKRFHLDELITGAVMAECQLHQRTFSYYDLEPLSRLLTEHVASLHQKQTAKVIMFKDLMDACSCVPEITLQRYFVALLSAAHQQNMGNIKDTRLGGLQILLGVGTLGRLSEVTINLSPCHSAPAA